MLCYINSFTTTNTNEVIFMHCGSICTCGMGFAHFWSVGHATFVASLRFVCRFLWGAVISKGFFFWIWVEMGLMCCWEGGKKRWASDISVSVVRSIFGMGVSSQCFKWGKATWCGCLWSFSLSKLCVYIQLVSCVVLILRPFEANLWFGVIFIKLAWLDTSSFPEALNRISQSSAAMNKWANG